MKSRRLANPTPPQYTGQSAGVSARWLALLLTAVFLLKFLIVFQLKDQPILHPDAGLDTTAYVRLARRVTAGDWFLGPGLYYVSPFYIYFLAAALALTHSFTAVRVMQAALGTATVGCIFMMGRDWFGTRAGWAAALLAAGTGLFSFYESLILQSSIDAFFTASALCALTFGLHAYHGSRTAPTANVHDRSSRPRAFRRAWFLLAGVIFGLATLNRPNMLIGAAAVVGACLPFRMWRPAVLLTTGLLLGLAPSIVRNAAVAGQWSLVSSHGGLNLYIGNNENATGFYREVPGIRPLIEGQQEDAITVASKALGRTVSDAEASAYFRRRATTWMQEHPADAARLFAKKIFFTFHAQHVALPHSYPFFAYDMDTALRFLIIGPWLLVPLGITGLVFAAQRSTPSLPSRWREFIIWTAFVPGYAFGVALFFVAERYRLPLFVPLGVGAGAAVDMAWRACTAKRLTGRVAWALVVCVAVAVGVNWRFALNDGRWDEGLRTAQRLVITGDYDAADAWVERLERSPPRRGRAHHGVGMQFVAEDKPERALKHLTRSLELGYSQRDDPEVWLRLGRLAARTQGSAAAAPFFQRAVQLAPEQASARQQHGLNLLLLGRIEDAKHELAAAVRLDPGDSDSLAHLAYCEIKLGETDQARSHVRAALIHAPDHQLARQLADALGLR